MTRERRSPSAAVIEGEILNVLADVSLIAGRQLTDEEHRRLTSNLDRIRLLEERRAARQLEEFAVTVSSYVERVKRAERERDQALEEVVRLRRRVT